MECISEINNTQIDNTKDLDVLMPMYSLIGYSNNSSKTSGLSWQHCRDEPTLNNDGAIVNLVANVTTSLFKIKEKRTGQTSNDRTNSAEIMVLLKYLSNLRRTLKKPLFDSEINLILSENCAIISTVVAHQGATFAITDVKLYVPVITLSS